MYAININDRNRAMVQFLNDDVPARPDQENHYLLCEFTGPRSISTKIISEDELYELKETAEVQIII
jgi:hypothetical protein